jgi:hypothetical protein
VIRIERIAEVFEVRAGGNLPFETFKVKVVERADGSFLAVPNVAVLDAITRTPEWVAGVGASASEAVADALKYLDTEIEEQARGRPFRVNDFAWSDPDDF